jgi:hypothetical protein
MVAPLAVPPDAALYRKLEDQGVSGTVSYPFAYALGPRSTLDQKRAHLERFANDVIRKLG